MSKSKPNAIVLQGFSCICGLYKEKTVRSRAVEVTVCADKLTRYRDFIAFASRDGHPSSG
jgi:hypothetical protein